MNTGTERSHLSASDVTWFREQLPSTEEGAYLNTGTAGPMPTPVIDTMRDKLETQLRLPRSGPTHLERYLALMTQDRSLLAPIFGCEPSEVALTHSTTEGMALVTLGIDWHAGDEAVTTTLEHPGALFPLYAARQRFGVALRYAAVGGLDDDGIVAAISEAMTPKTRLVSVSHVSYQNGLLLPIRQIADVVHARGARLLVDGAQSFAAIDVDVRGLGVDAYAASGQKWLCGPEGTGALYVAGDLLEQIHVTLASYGTAATFGTNAYEPHIDGRRLEFGTTNTVGYVGQIAAATFLTDTVGLVAAANRATALATMTLPRLDAIPGVTVLTPPDRHATLVSFTIAGVDAIWATEQLGDRAIHVRSIRELGAIRMSVGYFTTCDEVDRAIEAITGIAASRT